LHDSQAEFHCGSLDRRLPRLPSATGRPVGLCDDGCYFMIAGGETAKRGDSELRRPDEYYGHNGEQWGF
jgi:hypothetical protein